MIRFACPRCKAVLERPDNVAGGKLACPGCGQRLQVPLPPRDKTILGNLVAGDLPAPAPPANMLVPTGEATIRNLSGRDHVFWYCPQCQGQVDVALDLGQTAVRCPHCTKKIAVPPVGAATSGTPLTVLTPPLAGPLQANNPETPPASTSGKRQPKTPPTPPPLPKPPSSSRRPWNRDDDEEEEDYDDDFPSIARRRGRGGSYSKEAAIKAAATGFACSLIGVGLLGMNVFLWVVLVQSQQRFGGGRDASPILFVLLLVTLASFLLSLVGIIFSSRGMDESNNHNRGLAVAGLICGIIGIVISSIGGLCFLCTGTFLLPGQGW